MKQEWITAAHPYRIYNAHDFDDLSFWWDSTTHEYVMAGRIGKRVDEVRIGLECFRSWELNVMSEIDFAKMKMIGRLRWLLSELVVHYDHDPGDEDIER